MRPLVLLFRSATFCLVGLTLRVDSLPASGSPPTSSQTQSDGPPTTSGEHDVVESNIRPTIAQHSTPLHPDVTWQQGTVLEGRPVSASEHASRLFPQARPRNQGESSTSRATADTAHVESARSDALTDAQGQRILEGIPLTLAERHGLERVQWQNTHHQLIGFYDRLAALSLPPLVRQGLVGPPALLPLVRHEQAGPSSHPVSQHADIAERINPQEAQMRHTAVVPTDTAQQSTSMPRLSRANPEIVAGANPDPLVQTQRELGLVIANGGWTPSEPHEYTTVRHQIASFRFPHNTAHLKPVYQGRAKFTGIVGNIGGHVRFAATPDTPVELSKELLSGQRLYATKEMWRQMGMRIIFARDDRVAYALADAKTLKDVFPTMLEADRHKLQDGEAALVEIEKAGNQRFFRLFSVFDSRFLPRY